MFELVLFVPIFIVIEITNFDAMQKFIARKLI